MKRRETFYGLWMHCDEPGSLVGKDYIDHKTGKKIGTIIENSHLTFTVEFDEPIMVSVWQRIRRLFKRE